jgi:hypothetical protein
MAKAKIDTSGLTGAEIEAVEPKARGRVTEPFGRDFQLRLRFQNDMSDNFVSDIVDIVLDSFQVDDATSKRFTRGEPNDSQQTWRIADLGYEWAEQAAVVERGVRLKKSAGTDMLKKLAAQHGISVDAVLQMLLENAEQ